MAYVLHKAPVQLDTLRIVRYLHSIGVDATPFYCVERGHPLWVTELPSIEADDGSRYVGFAACVAFFRRLTGLDGLAERAVAFEAAAPDYRVNQLSKRSECH